MRTPPPPLRWFRQRLAPLLTVAAMVIGFGAATPALAADPQPLPLPGVVEDLGIPISSYLILDTVLSEDASGRPTLYGSTYNAPSDGVTFFGVDPISGDIRTQLTMPGAWGGYHVAAAPNGKIYLGPLNNASKAQIWEYDPVADSVSLVATMPTGIMCFGITVSEFTGKVYCGTHSGGGVYEYDPATQNSRMVTETLTYPKGLVTLDENRLVVAQGTNASVVIVDIATGAKTEVLPSEYAHYSFAYNAWREGGYVYVQLVTPDARIIQFDAATMTYIAEVTDTVSLPETSSLMIDGAEWSVGIGSTGELIRTNSATGEVFARQLSLPGDPTNITAMTSGPDGKLYGGTYETNAMFSFDPATGVTTEFGNVAPGRTGEILSMTTAEDKVFIGSYIENVVTVYDPTQPWNPGDDAGSNPRDLGRIGESQYRPWDMMVGPDDRVWVASSGDYGALRGALSAIDPVTYEVESYRGLAGDQHFFSLASDGDVLYAGTSRYGDDTDAGGEAQVLTVNPDTGDVLNSTVPVPGATRITALAVASGKLYGAADSKWFAIDLATGNVTQHGNFPHGAILEFDVDANGTLFATAGGAITRVAPGTDAVTLVATPGGSYYRTAVPHTDGALYWGALSSLKRVVPDMPAAWDAKRTYNKGDIVLFQGDEYTATWWTRGTEPGSPTGSWQENAANPNGTNIWTPSRIFNTGDIVTHNGERYTAKWWTRNQEPGTKASGSPWATTP